MCCLLVVIASGAPRVAIFLLWLFGDQMSKAYENFIIPAIGFLFLPWTTLFYALAYQGSATYNFGPGVTGFGWIIVGLGLVFDIMSYTGGYRQRTQQAAI